MHMPIGSSNRAELPMDVRQNHRDELRRRLPRCTGSPRFPSWVGLPRLRAHSYTGPSTQRFRRRRWSLPFSCPHFSGPCLGMGPEYRITARPRRAFPSVFSSPKFCSLLNFLFILKIVRMAFSYNENHRG